MDRCHNKDTDRYRAVRRKKDGSDEPEIRTLNYPTYINLCIQKNESDYLYERKPYKPYFVWILYWNFLKWKKSEKQIFKWNTSNAIALLSVLATVLIGVFQINSGKDINNINDKLEKHDSLFRKLLTPLDTPKKSNGGN